MLSHFLLATCLLYNVALSRGYLNVERLTGADKSYLVDFIRDSSNIGSLVDRCEHFWIQTNLITESYKQRTDNQRNQFDVVLTDFTQLSRALTNYQDHSQVDNKLMNFIEECKRGLNERNEPIQFNRRMQLDINSLYNIDKILYSLMFLNQTHKCNHLWFVSRKLTQGSRPEQMKVMDINDLTEIRNWLQNNRNNLGDEPMRQRVLSQVENCLSGNGFNQQSANIGSRSLDKSYPAISSQPKTYSVEETQVEESGFDPLKIFGAEFFRQLDQQMTQYSQDLPSKCEWLLSRINNQLTNQCDLTHSPARVIKASGVLLNMVRHELNRQRLTSDELPNSIMRCIENARLDIRPSKYTINLRKRQASRMSLPDYIEDASQRASVGVAPLIKEWERKKVSMNLNEKQTCAKIWLYLRIPHGVPMSLEPRKALEIANGNDLYLIAQRLNELNNQTLAKEKTKLMDCAKALGKGSGYVPSNVQPVVAYPANVNYSDRGLSPNASPTTRDRGLDGFLQSGGQVMKQQFHHAAQPYEAAAHVAMHPLDAAAHKVQNEARPYTNAVQNEIYNVKKPIKFAADVVRHPIQTTKRVSDQYIKRKAHQVAAPVEGAYYNGKHNVENKVRPVENAINAARHPLKTVNKLGKRFLERNLGPWAAPVEEGLNMNKH